MTPVVATTRGELDEALKRVRTGAAPLALVPTMGALHAGHVRLLREGRARCRSTVVSIFVNPMQFGPGEDYRRYPRSLDADLAVCGREDVAVVFAPGTEAVFPHGEPRVRIDPGPMAGQLEGASRPGHFQGVLTVVAKLFGVVRPDVAVFGEKDYQQLVLVRAMVRDLDFGVEVVAVPTVREPRGLAVSSRNRYLTAEQAAKALALSRALRAAADSASRGAAAARAAALAVLRDADGVTLDYLEVRDPGLAPAREPGDARVLVAARVGEIRLLDNVAVRLGSRQDVA